MTETFLSGGKSVRMQVHQPNTASPTPCPAIVLLHGAGGNTAFWLDRLAPALTSANVSLFAPHYFDRTGTERADFSAITDGIHVPQWLDTISAALASIRSRPDIDSDRIALLGISLGAFLALALAATRSASSDASMLRSIRCIVELSGGLVDPYASQATPAFPPTLILHGETDNIVPLQSARDLNTRLTHLNVPHEIKLLPNEGHWFSAMGQLQLLTAAAAFLRKHL